MKIHYLNAKGEETFLDGIMHLQNIDNCTWIAATKSGKELTLKTERIEGIADMHIIEKQEKTRKSVAKCTPLTDLLVASAEYRLKIIAKKKWTKKTAI